MELSTFGALLAFAIELEERAARFYSQAAESAGGADLKSAFLALARENARRRSLLVTTRQEHVTEMVLEPIRDLHRSDYEIEAEAVRGMSPVQLLKTAVEMEEREQRFYTDAAAKARHLLAGVARAFQRLGREKARRLAELKTLSEQALAEQ